MKKEIFIKKPDSLHFKIYGIGADTHDDNSYVIVFYGYSGKFGFLINKNFLFPESLTANFRNEGSLIQKGKMRQLPNMENALQYLCRNEPFFNGADTSSFKTYSKLELFLSCVFDSSKIGNLIKVENYHFLKNKFNLFSRYQEFFSKENKIKEDNFYSELKDAYSEKCKFFIRIGDEIINIKFQKYDSVKSYYFEVYWFDTYIH